eukprot:301083-Chlamydomonas_euryale.AAC.3
MERHPMPYHVVHSAVIPACNRAGVMHGDNQACQSHAVHDCMAHGTWHVAHAHAHACHAVHAHVVHDAWRMYIYMHDTRCMAHGALRTCTHMHTMSCHAVPWMAHAHTHARHAWRKSIHMHAMP